MINIDKLKKQKKQWDAQKKQSYLERLSEQTLKNKSDYDEGVQSANKWLELESTTYQQIKSLAEGVNDLNSGKANNLNVLLMIYTGSQLLGEYTKDYLHTRDSQEYLNGFVATVNTVYKQLQE